MFDALVQAAATIAAVFIAHWLSLRKFDTTGIAHSLIDLSKIVHSNVASTNLMVEALERFNERVANLNGSISTSFQELFRKMDSKS